MRSESTVLCAALLTASFGCAMGASGRPGTPSHDKPTASKLAHAELDAVVELEVAANCEEAFDLALYKSPGVERIAWDEKAGKCSGRHVVIRYLSQAVKEAELIAMVEKLARSVEAHRGGTP